MANNLNHGGLRQLERSLKHNGWDYHIIEAKYERFGSKQVAFYEYLKAHPEITHAFLCDAYDVFVLGSWEEVLQKIPYYNHTILFNAERACWPYADWATLYPECDGPWKYLNGGAAFVDSKVYIRMFEENPISHQDNDQVNLAKIFLSNRDEYCFNLDTKCKIFQSIAFEDPADFDCGCGRLFNNYHHTRPNIIHGNGKTSMEHIYQLIPLL